MLALVVILALSFTVAGDGRATEQGAAGKPRLRVVALTPFSVVGSGFRRGETVRVSVNADGGAASTRDLAGASGRIDVRFRSVKLDSCPDYVVLARGNKGSRAGLRSVPRACGIDPGRSP